MQWMRRKGIACQCCGLLLWNVDISLTKLVLSPLPQMKCVNRRGHATISWKDCSSSCF